MGQITDTSASHYPGNGFNFDLPLLGERHWPSSGSETESESDNEVGLHGLGRTKDTSIDFGGIEDTCIQVDSFIDHETFVKR